MSNDKKIGIIGSGTVAQTLGSGLAKKGWSVMLGTREPAKLAEWGEKNPSAKVGTMEEAAAHGRLVILAVKGTAAETAAGALKSSLNGRVVLDACNPIADAAPEDGVLRFFTGPNESLMERLQKLAPEARFVKCFSSVGAPLMIDPKPAGGPPTMFICGDDAQAKKETAALLAGCGWEAADMGTAKAARAIEPLCMLWCIPGLREGRWSHAFKLLRA